ncbi:RES domain-containing protein [Methylocystis echinoides]|uniref:RES family NAD+ phosphorylase n=1 Tax=Methylocystis echinoides TaxID=29468 RepID=UPI0034238FD2
MTAKRVPTIAVARRYWRMLAPKWAHDPLSGAGAALRGDRFNPPGTPALYMSEEFSTAVAEYEQDLGIRPGTLCAYDVRCDRIVDLGDPETRRALGVDDAVLRGPWQQIAFVEKREPPTWSLVARLRAAHVAGVRAPSAQAPGFNLVLWTWNVDGAARVVALDPLRDLPTDQSSWKSP